MKAAIPDYMKFGAEREMHGSNAAGTAIEINVEDDGRTFFVAHIVDPVAVTKVKTGVYKGFSIGGSVTAHDELNKSQITGLKLTEISLVDRPANPDAVFTCFKADKGAEAVNNDTEHNATYFSHFPSKQKTKKHRRRPMPLPLQVPLFFIRGQSRFCRAFWCGCADGSLILQLRQHRRADALYLGQIVHRLERTVLRTVFRNGLRLRRAYAWQRLQLLQRSRIDVYRRKGEGAGEQHTEQHEHFLHGFSFKGCKQ